MSLIDFAHLKNFFQKKKKNFFFKKKRLFPTKKLLPLLVVAYSVLGCLGKNQTASRQNPNIQTQKQRVSKRQKDPRDTQIVSLETIL